MLKISDYDFELPKELIAQFPTEQRGESRLLVIERSTKKISHKRFYEITEFFSSDDCLVINNTQVIPARVFAQRKTGGKIEILFTKITTPYAALALLKPSLKEGEKIFINDHAVATIGSKILTKNGESTGEREIIFNAENLHQELIRKYGIMPLPPYIKRKKPSMNDFNDADSTIALDKSRYQTIYARHNGSIAAPTAGLHFTTEILKELRNKGVTIAEITLHVGLGTFKKVLSEDISQHKMLPEEFFIPPDEADKINTVIKNGGRIFSTGTTTTRAIETMAVLQSNVHMKKSTSRKYIVSSGEDVSSLYIYPGYKFKIVDCLITNFHLPRSTPLFLAAAFCGKDLLFNAYKEAIKEGYKFFSYGDATLIL